MKSVGTPLPQLLLDARRWFDEALVATLEQAGMAPISPTQAQLFAALDEKGTTVSELARRMGVTRQTAHQAVHSLIGMGLLEQVPDPSSARRRLIRRTGEGTAAHLEAVSVLAALEDELALRIGRGSVDSLRAALEAPRGDPPTLRIKSAGVPGS
ncbi:MarR family winged helix-turn-helix transcriptional regulator [Streptomyces tauricus]|uniref:MarR family winged helix-turn-helix transcriptional regulator n=1 Tax=Streptomyces tauricus TaxID=68274 RepID=UPI0022449AF7|nr:MarR family winged helix-turn-helix transcriptional regulator [Streptomyces tauricus]MCW8096213.1 MarR family winged helix-turn-helix transcriptional regulator [Streptomyces tauricus]